MAARSARSGPARSYVDVRAQGGQPLLADPRHVVEVVDAAEAAVLAAVLDDLLRRRGPDAVERAQLLRARGVEVDRRPGRGLPGPAGGNAGRGVRRRTGGPAARARRHHDLPPILQTGREVERLEVGAAG